MTLSSSSSRSCSRTKKCDHKGCAFIEPRVVTVMRGSIKTPQIFNTKYPVLTSKSSHPYGGGGGATTYKKK